MKRIKVVSGTLEPQINTKVKDKTGSFILIIFAVTILLFIWSFVFFLGELDNELIVYRLQYLQLAAVFLSSSVILLVLFHINEILVKQKHTSYIIKDCEIEIDDK